MTTPYSLGIGAKAVGLSILTMNGVVDVSQECLPSPRALTFRNSGPVVVVDVPQTFLLSQQAEQINRLVIPTDAQDEDDDLVTYRAVIDTLERYDRGAASPSAGSEMIELAEIAMPEPFAKAVDELSNRLSGVDGFRGLYRSEQGIESELLILLDPAYRKDRLAFRKIANDWLDEVVDQIGYVEVWIRSPGGENQPIEGFALVTDGHAA